MVRTTEWSVNLSSKNPSLGIEGNYLYLTSSGELTRDIKEAKMFRTQRNAVMFKRSFLERGMIVRVDDALVSEMTLEITGTVEEQAPE